MPALKRGYHEMQQREDLTSTATSTRTSRAQSPSGAQHQASSSSQNTTRNSETIERVPNSSRKASFDPFASIVLIGTRGVGTSTLGLLAATAYNRRLIDSDREFKQATGHLPGSYRKLHGIEQFIEQHDSVLGHILTTYSTGAVIICSFSDLEGNGTNLIRRFGQSHAIVHITRDVGGIRTYLNSWTIESISKLLSASSSRLRSVSNYEFFNLSENGDNVVDELEPERPIETSSHQKPPQRNFLTLKRVERDFLRLLRNILGDTNRGASHRSAYPLSQVSIENLPWTNAVSLTVPDILQNHYNLADAEIGADSVELVVSTSRLNGQDALGQVARAFATVRRASILPIQLSIRNDHDPLQEQKYSTTDVVQGCLRLGPEFCTVDLSLSDTRVRRIVKSKGGSKLIGTLAFAKDSVNGWDDDRCIAAYDKAAELGFEFVKMTMPAVSVDDTYAVQSFRQRVEALQKSPKLIAYCTGPEGRPSRCFNKTLTPVKPPATTTASECDESDDDGSITSKEVTQALFATFMVPPRSFYIYGADVSYSLSPTMHNVAYQACGLSYDYSAHSSDSIEDFDRLVSEPTFGGMAVVQPFKTTLISKIDGLSRHTRAIGAINSIVPVYERLPNGDFPDEVAMIAQRTSHGVAKGLFGYNTDWIGIRACVRRSLSPANAIRPTSTGLVCGAGGMARAAVYSLLSLGVRNVYICNRTYEKAVALANHYNEVIESDGISELSREDAAHTRVRVVESFTSAWPADARQPTMIVCCVPRQTVSRTPTAFSLPEPWLESPNGGVVVEVAYREPVSPLVKQIQDRSSKGWIFVGGIEFLCEQAFSQFELFTGRRAPRALMKKQVINSS